MPGVVNPYAMRERVPGEAPGPMVALLPHIAYEVPDVPESTDPTNTGGGFSPELTPSSDGSRLPDDIRIGKREPPENDPNDYDYSMRRDHDRKVRQSDEHTSESWNVRQQKVAAPVVPEWTQERAPTRPTAVRSPLGYLFTRPMGHPRNIKDAVGEEAETHVSMADHRRTYPIGGMQPQGKVGRNTFRLDPRPWDEGLVNAIVEPTPDSPMSSAFGGNRNFRLG